MSFEGIILEYFENMRRQLEAKPLLLGAISYSGGGLGSRPGGYAGYLPQYRVAYDLTEGATLATSGTPSLLDNLNHIRYRLGVLEASGVGGSGSLSIKEDNVLVASGVTIIDFGSGFGVTESPAGEVNITVTASGGAGHDPVTVSDTSTVDLTLTGQDISATVIASGIDHTSIQNTGTNTHAQIDTHISDTSIHFDELGELSDVSVATAVSGQVLTYNGSLWIPTTSSGAAGEHTHTSSDITDLADITVADTGTLNLVNDGVNLYGHVTPSGINLGQLGDINTATVVSGQVLTYEGSIWIPTTVSGGGSHTHTSSDITDLADITVSGTATLDLINDGTNLYGNVIPSGITHASLSGLSSDDHIHYVLADGSRNITGNQTFEKEITVASGIINLATTGKFWYDEVVDTFKFEGTAGQSYYQVSPTTYWVNVQGYDMSYRVDSQNITNILSVAGEDNLVGVGGIYLYPWRVYLRNTVAVERGIHINQSQGDYDTVIEGNTDTNLVYVDAGNDRVGIGTNTPNDKLEVSGRIREEGTFASIYVSNNGSAQSIPTGTTYTKLTAFASNGESSNCTADATNDKITFTKTGRYMVVCSMNGYTGSANQTFEFTVFLNGVEQTQVHSHRKYTNASDYGSNSMSGIIDVTTTSWDLDVRGRHGSGGSVDFTAADMNLTVYYLGET